MSERGKFGRVGVLMGGPSSEREISLKSGKGVLQALKTAGVDSVAVDITSDDAEKNKLLIKGAAIDCAFIALHGFYGEDGQVQQLLQDMGIPYTGSAPEAHRVALDKTRAREVFLRLGLKVPECIVITKGACRGSRDEAASLGLPLVVKPATQGSSIGLTIIDSIDDLGRALDSAFKYDTNVLVERYIKGREFTVGILEGAALPVIEIVPKNRYFDFEAKYKSGMTDYIVPAKIPHETALRAQKIAAAAHRGLGCSGCSRTDILLEAQTDELFVLEVNTIPGLTPTSLLPKAAAVAGIDFPELCLRMLGSAYEKK